MESPTAKSPFARLLTIDWEQLTPSERSLLWIATLACWVIVPAILFFTLANTYRDICTYSGDDLRNRVVGARVMLAGYDPYTFFWTPGMPEELLDPVHEPKAHRLTISPPTLFLYAPLAPLPAPTKRFVSFVCEWLAMLASLALLTWSLSDPRQRIVFLLGASLFVIASDIWRLHVEKGQVYVFQLLALSTAIAWGRRRQTDSYVVGVALGVLALMRPNLLVIAPALLILRQWRASSAMLTTVGVGLIATFVMLPTSSWPSYLGVGDQYYRAVDDPGPGPNDMPAPDHVGPVEGVVFGHSLPDVSCSSVAHFYYVMRTRFDLPRIDLAVLSKLMLAVMACALLAVIWQRRRGNVWAGFALIVMLSLDTEFFLPHRWGYVDVMLLAPLALMLPTMFRGERSHVLAIGIVLAGVASGLFGHAFFDLHAVTVLRSWLVMGGLTAIAFCDPGRDVDATPQAA